jgi:hypothetical protein
MDAMPFGVPAYSEDSEPFAISPLRRPLVDHEKEHRGSAQ